MSSRGFRSVLERLSTGERRSDVSVALYCHAFGTEPAASDGSARGPRGGSD